MLFRPHPVFGWVLAPNGKVKVRIRENVVQTVGADGWRHHPPAPVKPARPEKPAKARPNLVIYGCSFTYGSSLADDETYAAILQKNMPDWRVQNKGIGGYGTVQNYLQFRQDIKQDIKKARVDAAVFGVISDHRFRNVPHPQRMRQLQNDDWYELGVEHIPTVLQNRAGKLGIKYVPIWQPSIKRDDFQAFLPSDHMLDVATLSVLEAITELARQNKIPVIFALLDQLDPAFNQRVLSSFPEALDISVPHDEDHTFLPRDVHPNVKANQIYARRLLPEILARTSL